MTSNIKCQYHYVHSHLDDTTALCNLSVPEQLNVLADKLTKDALLEAIETGQYCGSLFPNEYMRVFIAGIKATTSLKTTLYQTWGQRTAKTLFDSKNILPQQHFDIVH